MEELKGYERYQLQWMIEHGYSIMDLFSRLDEIVQESYPSTDRPLPSWAYEDFEEIGFKESEIWTCHDEWEDNEMEEYISYNVGFINDSGKEDETQFDIPAIATQTEAIEELMDLFHYFCEENGIEKAYIIGINESE
ncbi:MAG: hypothetical protein ACLSVX_01480 [Massilimicrobiota timonensis]